MFYTGMKKVLYIWYLVVSICSSMSNPCKQMILIKELAQLEPVGGLIRVDGLCSVNMSVVLEFNLI